MFRREAGKYQVFPVDNSGFVRLLAPKTGPGQVAETSLIILVAQCRANRGLSSIQIIGHYKSDPRRLSRSVWLVAGGPAVITDHEVRDIHGLEVR
jgi:hypothetical protein